MKRRDFLKGALLTTVALSSGAAIAATKEKTNGKKKKKKKDIHKLENRENPSELEQKHVPAIEAPEKVSPGQWFDVKVKVGFMKEHPSTRDHWISMIKLSIDGKVAALSKYRLGGISPSYTTFRIRLKKTSKIGAVEKCSLHGMWVGDPVTIKVV